MDNHYPSSVAVKFIIIIDYLHLILTKCLLSIVLGASFVVIKV